MYKQLNMGHREKGKIIFTWIGKNVSPTDFSLFFYALIINIYYGSISMCS